MTNLIMQKELLRIEMLKRRAAQDAESRAAADAQITKRVLSLPSFQDAEQVFCFISVGDEVDTRALISEALLNSKSVYAPRCVGKSVMHAHALLSLDDLEPGMMDIPTPPAASRRIKPQQLDLIIVPCLTCNEAGYRLGYGGGYYDRYLASAPQATKVLLCREHLVSERIPLEEHDVSADIVVTEKQVLSLF